MNELSFSSNKVLGYMHMHITRVGLKAQTFQGWLTSFLIGCVAYDFVLSNNLTSSRTFGD